MYYIILKKLARGCGRLLGRAVPLLPALCPRHGDGATSVCSPLSTTLDLLLYHPDPSFGSLLTQARVRHHQHWTLAGIVWLGEAAPLLVGYPCLPLRSALSCAHDGLLVPNFDLDTVYTWWGLGMCNGDWDADSISASVMTRNWSSSSWVQIPICLLHYTKWLCENWNFDHIYNFVWSMVSAPPPPICLDQAYVLSSLHPLLAKRSKWKINNFLRDCQAWASFCIYSLQKL